MVEIKLNNCRHLKKVTLKAARATQDLLIKRSEKSHFIAYQRL